jgi:hypothetical protein
MCFLRLAEDELSVQLYIYNRGHSVAMVEREMLSAVTGLVWLVRGTHDRL